MQESHPLSDSDAQAALKVEPIDQVARMLFAPFSNEDGVGDVDDDDPTASEAYRAIYRTLVTGQDHPMDSYSSVETHPSALDKCDRQVEGGSEGLPPSAAAVATTTTSTLAAVTSPMPSIHDTNDSAECASDVRRATGRRTNAPKTVYRDAPAPLEGHIYNPVRFQYNGDPFDRGTRARPHQSKYREFSGHATEVGTRADVFRVYIIDDIERKKGATRYCSLPRALVRDIVWDLPERRDHNDRIVHGVPPTPTDEYQVRIDPAFACLPISQVKMHQRTRVFLTVRDPPPAGPLVNFTIGPLPPEPLAGLEHVRAALRDIGTADAAAVVTTRGESLEYLDPTRDLVNLGQEASLAVPVAHMLAVRLALVSRDFLVKDGMFRERALHIGPMGAALLKREAEALVDRCRASGLGEDAIVLSAEMPLRTYVIMRLAELGSKCYNNAYLANPRYRDMFKDRGPRHLSPEQTVQLSDAFYWVHLAPEGQRVKKFEEVIRFYQQRGVDVRLNKPHVKSGASVGRTSESGALRSFKRHSRATHSVLKSRYMILAPSGESQALRTVKPRAKAPTPAERNPAAAHIDRLATEAARSAPKMTAARSGDALTRRLGNTGIARFLKVPNATTTPTASAVLSLQQPSRDQQATSESATLLRHPLYIKPVVIAPELLAVDSCEALAHLDRDQPQQEATCNRDPTNNCPIDADRDRKRARTATSVLGTHGDSLSSRLIQPSLPDASMQSQTDAGALHTAPDCDTDAHRTNDDGDHKADSTSRVHDEFEFDDSDLLSLRRSAIAFPDPIIVGAPPQGLTETVLTWSSIRDKISRIETAAPDTSASSAITTPIATAATAHTTTTATLDVTAAGDLAAPARGKSRRREKSKKNRSKDSSRSQRDSARSKKRSTKKQRIDAEPRSAAPNPQPPSLPVAMPLPSSSPSPLSQTISMARLVAMLPRQGEPLFLPIVHLHPQDGMNALPGVGAPYVQLPCPTATTPGAPRRILLQQLPVLMPPYNAGAVSFAGAAGSLPVPRGQAQSDKRPPPPLAVQSLPFRVPAHPAPATSTLSQSAPSLGSLPPPPLRSSSCALARSTAVAEAVPNDSDDWLNLLSLTMDTRP
jgi:hypothetical protein